MQLKIEKKITLIMAMLISISLTACGGGGGSGSSDSNNDIDDNSSSNNSGSIDLNDNTEVLKSMKLSIKRKQGGISEGILVEGEIPSPTFEVGTPVAVSFPKNIVAKKGDSLVIDLVYSSPDVLVPYLLNEFYVGIQGTGQHYKISQTSSTSSSSLISGERFYSESIQIDLKLSEYLKNGEICMEFAVAITSFNFDALTSNITDICFDIKETDVKQRLIYSAAFEDDSTLYSYNLDTQEKITIGKTGLQITDIALLNGKLYGVTFESLVEINKDTAETSFIGETGISGVNALVGGRGILYGATDSGQFITIDRTTGMATIVNNFDSGITSAGDLAFNEDETKIWGTVQGRNARDGGNHLLEIDPITGNSIMIGSIGFDNMWGLVYFRNQLLGMQNYGPLIGIDISTGRGGLLGYTVPTGGAANKNNDID